MTDEDEVETDAPDDAPDDASSGEDGDAEPDAGAEEGEETETGLQNGDFVRIDYTVRTVEDGRVVDTTVEEVAEDSDIDTEDHEFSPRVLVVGAGHVFRSVDEDLAGREPGDERTVTVPAEEAFGEFDPDDVRTISAEKIPEDDRYPGAQVTVDGESGFVETIIGGRARVDFNHPLAGDDLEYEYEVLEVVEDRTEKARGLLGMYLEDVPAVRIEVDEVEEEVEVEVESEDDGDDDDEDAEPEYETEVRTVEKETLYIEATPMMAMNQQWLFQKQQIAQQLMTRLDLDRVVVEEVLEGPGGMMGGMGGMMGGMGGAGAEDVEAALDDVDVDADEIVEELEGVETDE